MGLERRAGTALTPTDEDVGAAWITYSLQYVFLAPLPAVPHGAP